MITIATFSLPIEAQIARAKLDSEGIPAFVADEHTINAQWLYSNALGGVRLQVPDCFAEQANNILAQDYSELLIAEQGIDSKHCLYCGNEKLEPIKKTKRIAFIVFFFFNIPLPFKTQFACLRCGKINEFNKL